MNRTQRTVLVAAAMTGILAGCMTSSGCAKSSDTTMANAPGTNATAADTGKHDCKGKNTCKGQGGCKTGDNGCKGKNSCSGKGGCKTNV
ncbi:MAG: hypothetical protein ABSE48_12795 [Verrucomicrobiota bacterium]|jgi:hypothetical protein